MRNSNQEEVTAFFSLITYDPKGRCHFAEKELDGGRRLYFTARAENAGDLEMLTRSMQAHKQFSDNEREYIERICAALDQEEAAPYLHGGSAMVALGDGLVLTSIDTETMDDTNLTFEDTSQVLGGHVVHAFFGADWALKGVSIDDM